MFANAGIAAVPGYANRGGQELHTVADDVWRRVLAVNLDGVLHTMRAAAAVMKPQRSGRIVVTASTAGLRADPMVCYGYAASKAAVINVAKQAALELAPHGVHVNVIAPGPIKTRIGGGVTPESEKAWAALVPLGRMGETEELKGLALLLASRASSFMTGAVITIDGGQLLGEPGGWYRGRQRAGETSRSTANAAEVTARTPLVAPSSSSVRTSAPSRIRNTQSSVMTTSTAAFAVSG